MRAFLRVVLFLTLLVGSTLPASTALAADPPPNLPGCQTGTIKPTGALWAICVPPVGWSGDLLVYAHGYTAFNEPIGFQNLVLPDGTYLPELVMSLGYAFATTSYRQNGLAVLDGVKDVMDVIGLFPKVVGAKPTHTYLAGVSEGGVVTTLAAEQFPDKINGALATCAPIGDFQAQIDYYGDFRVLFDFFFPGVLPPSPMSIPAELITDWQTVYTPAVVAALQANPAAAIQLIGVSRAAIDPANPLTVGQTTLDVLWYNVFATNDAVDKLHGNPYSNADRWYTGSANDEMLNATAQRFSADPSAIGHLNRYRTSGDLAIPLVTMHTLRDPVIPFWHELLYQGKAAQYDLTRLTIIPVDRYGHCAFTGLEVLAAFGLLVEQVTGSQPPGLVQQFNLEEIQHDFAAVAPDLAAP